jgi:putative transposase
MPHVHRGKSDRLLCQGERSPVAIYRLIAAERASYPASLLCRVLGVARSGFYAWERRAPSARALADAYLSEQIRRIWKASGKTYGSRRCHAKLGLEGIRVSRKRVERLMRLEGISGLAPRRRRRTTLRVEGVRPAPDLVDREFDPEAPNLLWCADITYLQTWEGTVYLAAVMDCFSRRIVGWSMPTTCERSWSSTRSRWRWPAVAPTLGSSITQTRARNTSR